MHLVPHILAVLLLFFPAAVVIARNAITAAGAVIITIIIALIIIIIIRCIAVVESGCFSVALSLFFLCAVLDCVAASVEGSVLLCLLLLVARLLLLATI